MKHRKKRTVKRGIGGGLSRDLEGENSGGKAGEPRRRLTTSAREGNEDYWGFDESDGGLRRDVPASEGEQEFREGA